jgi:hypothetical protein
MSQVISGWLFVVVGTVLVGVGGSLATLGWNKVRSHEQWRSAVIGVAREVKLNDRLMEASTALLSRWPTRSMGENLPTESYYSSHVTAIVTSGRPPAAAQLPPSVAT